MKYVDVFKVPVTHGISMNIHEFSPCIWVIAIVCGLSYEPPKWDAHPSGLPPSSTAINPKETGFESAGTTLDGVWRCMNNIYPYLTINMYQNHETMGVLLAIDRWIEG